MSNLPGPLGQVGLGRDSDLLNVPGNPPSNDAIASSGSQREGTPSPDSPIPSIKQPTSTLLLDTPIKHASATTMPFSTFSRFRHRTMHVMGREMKDYLVGPMPPKDFLSRFFPTSKIWNYRAVEFMPRAVSTQRCRNQIQSPFSNTIRSEREVDAYKPFVSHSHHPKL